MPIKYLSVISLIFAAFIGIQGCSIIPKTAKTGVQVSQAEADAIQDGKSSKEDVVLAFGEPSKILEDGKIWIYSGSKSTEWLGIPFGGSKRLVIVFENGKVKQHNFKTE